MTYNITILEGGTARIDVSFADEGVDLQGTTTVKGGETEAATYVPTFERDLRRNYAHLFPEPEIIVEEHDEEGDE